MRVLVIPVVLILVIFGFVYVDGLTEVEKSALFDIVLEIPLEHHIVNFDEKIGFTLKLVNLGGEGRIDVFLEYSILDSGGNVFLSKRETVAIETQASFFREMDLRGIPPGNYEIYARMVYSDNKIADSRHSFQIRRVVPDFIWFFLSVFFVVFVVFLYFRVKLLRDKIGIKLKVRKIVKNR